MAIYLVNAFCYMSIHRHQKHLALTWQGQYYTFTDLPRGHSSSPALGHNLFHKASCWPHYFDTMILEGYGEEEEANTLDILIRYKNGKEWKLKNEGAATLTKFLRSNGLRYVSIFPPKCVTNCCPSSKKDGMSQRASFHFGSCMYHIGCHDGTRFPGNLKTWQL